VVTPAPGQQHGRGSIGGGTCCSSSKVSPAPVQVSIIIHEINVQKRAEPQDIAEIETGMAEKSSPGTRQTDGKKLFDL
jgi:hypothetical protein